MRDFALVLAACSVGYLLGLTARSWAQGPKRAVAPAAGWAELSTDLHYDIFCGPMPMEPTDRAPEDRLLVSIRCPAPPSVFHANASGAVLRYGVPTWVRRWAPGHPEILHDSPVGGSTFPGLVAMELGVGDTVNAAVTVSTRWGPVETFSGPEL